MQRKNNAIRIMAATLGVTTLAGFVSVLYADETTIIHYPNDRANHHPKYESARENQAVVTQLGANATAVSYWSSAPDGWHVVTTVNTVIGEDTDTEHHAIVRFSATLAPGQEQLISVPLALGEPEQVLRIRRKGDRIEMARIANPSM